MEGATRAALRRADAASPRAELSPPKYEPGAATTPGADPQSASDCAAFGAGGTYSLPASPKMSSSLSSAAAAARGASASAAAAAAAAAADAAASGQSAGDGVGHLPQRARVARGHAFRG